MKTRLTLWCAGVLVAAAVAPVGASASGTFTVMTDDEKQTKLLDIAANFVPRAEKFWINDGGVGEDCENAIEIPQTTGLFNACSNGVPQDRGLSSLAYDYATLIYARSAASTFGGIPRATVNAHLKQTLLQLTYTNDHFDPDPNDDPDADEYWGGPSCDRPIGGDHCEAAITAFEFAWALYLTQHDGDSANDLSSTELADANTVIKAEANISLGLEPESGSSTNSFAEENIWEAMLLSVAAAIYPTDPNQSAWADDAKDFTINASVRHSDDTAATPVIDGVALGDWWKADNVLNEDLTLTNHGFFNPLYSQGIFASATDNSVFYAATGRSLPQAFTFRLGDVWHDVIAPFAWEDGDLLMPSGTDWVNHDYQHIPYLSAIASKVSTDDGLTTTDQTVATVLESRAIQKLYERQSEQPATINGNPNPLVGSLYGMPHIGYEADVVRNLTEAWWIHEEFGPSLESVTESQFNAAFDDWYGVRSWTNPSDASDRDTVINKGPNALVSMHWRYGSGSYPTAYVVPSVRNNLDDPVLVQYIRSSGINFSAGSAHSCDCTNGSNYFSTAGHMTAAGGATRDFSMSTFKDGSTLMLDRGTGPVFEMTFENDPYLWTGSATRPVYYDAGSTAGTAYPGTNLTGSWANIDNRYGMVVRAGAGGANLNVSTFADTSGKADIANPQLEVSGSSSGANDNRGALILPTANAQLTSQVASDVQQPTVPSSAWSALTARVPDGTARITTARFTGSGSGTISDMTTSVGAPIPDRNLDITVNPTNDAGGTNKASMTENYTAPESHGWEGYFYVSSDHTVTVHPQSATLIKLTNGGSTSSVTVRYADGSGKVYASTLSIPANAVAYAEADKNGAATEGVELRLAKATSSASGHGPDQATDANTGASSYWSSSAGPNQDLWIDYGKAIDLAGVTMTPIASNGPKNYTVSLSSNSSCADGTSGYSVVDTKTNASSSSATTSSFAATTARCVLLHTTASWGSLVKVAELARVRPSIDIDLADPQPDASGLAQINVARGGVNSATVTIRNNTGTSQSVTVSASGLPTGVTSNSPAATVPANSSSNVTLTLTGGATAPTSGTTAINVTGTSAASAPMTIRHTDNLALNDTGTALPTASSDGEDPSFLYPAKLAFDGSTGSSSMWVSRPANLGAGDPVCLVIDLGSSMNVGRAVMTPRTSPNYGPKDYKVQTSTTGGSDCASNTGWTDRATVTNASATSPTTSTWTPVSARYLRIRITANQGSGPPFQSQVRELGVYPN